jgi:formylglycine-generating enzyme required for sulfatase activity
MAERFRYAAFVSYSSKDARFAQRLHRALERYRIPAALGEFRLAGQGGRRNRVYPVFRDREELSAGDLGHRIEDGLRQSAALIVVCSPNAAQSPWVQKEIDFFIKLGRRDRIFAIIADTAPLKDKGGGDATQSCFPPGLRGDALTAGARAIEPLAADARPGKDGFRNAVLKLVAGLIGVTPGQVIDRDRSMRREQFTRAAALWLVVLLGAGFAYSQRAVLEPMAVSWWKYKRFAHSQAALMAAAPGAVFQDCRAGTLDCPAMVVVPEGQFMMGMPADAVEPNDNRVPQRQISVARFAVARDEITFDQWRVCVDAGRCPLYPNQDEGFGMGAHPVSNITWEDASAYAAWLSDMTGHQYRLLTEAEWEYAARAGATTRFSWGDEDPVCDHAAPNGAAFADCNEPSVVEVGQFRASAFGLRDMHGNAAEWVEDCYALYDPNQRDTAAAQPGALAPERLADGERACVRRVIRGGSILWGAEDLSSSKRDALLPIDRVYTIGFRVARTL